MIEKILIFTIIGLLGFIPIISLYRHYIYTKILDYFLLGTAFLIVVLQSLVLVLLEITDETLLLLQFNDILYPSFILMFLIHGARLRWDRTPNAIKIIATLWYLLLVIAVFFYSIIELPNEDQVLFLHLKNTSNKEEGQMLIVNGIYIIGRGFELIAHSFRLFSIGLILYSYSHTREFANEIKISLSHNIFIFAIISSAVLPILVIGEMFFIWNNVYYLVNTHIFDIFTFLGISIIALKYPETLLISKTQILRVYKINQDLLVINQKNMTDEEKIKKIKEYFSFLKQVYPGLMAEKNQKFKNKY